MKKYKVVSCVPKTEEVNNTINQLENEGWEMVPPILIKEAQAVAGCITPTELFMTFMKES